MTLLTCSHIIATPVNASIIPMLFFNSHLETIIYHLNQVFLVTLFLIPIFRISSDNGQFHIQVS